MKIKTQVSISIIVFIILAVVILFSYFSSENQLYEIQKKQQIIDNIEKSSFELYYLENDYFIHGGTRTVERWNAKYAALTGQLKELTLTDPAQQTLLNSMLNSHADLPATFFDLVAVTDSAQGKESISASQSVKEFAASTLTGHTQMMMSKSSELSQLVKAEALEVGKRTSLIISSSIAVLMIFVLLNYLFINRSVLRSISALEKGTKRIGSGNLDTKIETGSNDEMSDLSVAITAMAANLKTVLTSKSNLEKEVAERKLAQDALKDSEQRLFEIISFLPDATFAINRNGTVISWNRAMEEMTGVPAAQIIGKGNYEYSLTFYGVRRPILIDLVFSSIEEISKNYSSVNIKGDVLTAETVTASPRGEKVVLWGRAAPLYGREGNVTGAIESIRDITDRKRAEVALHESEERYRSLFVDSRDAIMILSLERGFLAANPATFKLFSCQNEQDFLARSPASLSPEYQPDGVLSTAKSQEMMHLALKNGSNFFEWTHRRLDGTNFQALVLLSRLEIEGQQILQATVRDITDRKRAEDALRQANKKLTLLSSITRHDINNQLTVLVGYLTILKKKQPDTTQNDYFQKIAAAAQNISSMIQFTREYESIGVKAPAWQDCRTLVDTAAKDAPLGKIIVKNDLPAGQEVFADPLIVKVFYNLMDNAVRYGEKITTIRFYALESGDDHIVVCEDDGDGVADEEKEKIFSRGFGKNTGLGLALSREILSITGITICENGEPGKGARFEMMVPKGAWRSVRKDA